MHEPVLLKESIAALHIQKHGKYIDATLGAAGHTIEILKLGGDVLGIDQDEEMLEVARENIVKACPANNGLSDNGNVVGSFTLAHANFKDIDKTAEIYKFHHVDGILMDLGISSLHLDVFERGFSFKRANEPLDMRLDQSLGVKASDLLNALDRKGLEKLFSKVLDYKETKITVSRIIKFREENKFINVRDLLEVNPDAKAFMAIRMAVNTELEVLEEALPKAFDLLKPGANLAVISFHSGEDRIVKNFKSENHVSKKPILPSEEELKSNPRAKSAKLRIIKR